MVGAVVFGNGTLAIHQEAVPPPLLGQRVLVALCDVVVQLTLLVADGFHKLQEEKWLHQPSAFEVAFGKKASQALQCYMVTSWLTQIYFIIISLLLILPSLCLFSSSALYYYCD